MAQESPTDLPKFEHVAIPPFANGTGSDLPSTAPESMAGAVIGQLRKEHATAFRDVTTTPSNHTGELLVQGTILKYNPGSKAARFILIGLGAGSLELEVAFIDAATGKTLEKFTTSGSVMAGGVMGATMGIEDMMASAAKKIVERLTRYGTGS